MTDPATASIPLLLDMPISSQSAAIKKSNKSKTNVQQWHAWFTPVQGVPSLGFSSFLAPTWTQQSITAFLGSAVCFLHYHRAIERGLPPTLLLNTSLILYATTTINFLQQSVTLSCASFFLLDILFLKFNSLIKEDLPPLSPPSL